MLDFLIRIYLLSDTTFGYSETFSSSMDINIQRDEFGLPLLTGKSLKGVLVSSSMELLSCLNISIPSKQHIFRECHDKLFGGKKQIKPLLRIGNASLPHDLLQAIEKNNYFEKESQNSQLIAAIIHQLTQTAVDENRAAKNGSLRKTQVILKGTIFESHLEFFEPPTITDLAFLAAIVKSMQRIGLGQTRGRGLIRAELFEGYSNISTTDRFFDIFSNMVQQA